MKSFKYFLLYAFILFLAFSPAALEAQAISLQPVAGPSGESHYALHAGTPATPYRDISGITCQLRVYYTNPDISLVAKESAASWLFDPGTLQADFALTESLPGEQVYRFTARRKDAGLRSGHGEVLRIVAGSGGVVILLEDFPE